MRFPLALTAKIAGHIVKHKMREHPSSRMVLATRAAAHLQSDLHRLRPHPRIFHEPQGHDDPGGLPGVGAGMRCADGFDLRRRTADLSEDRGTGRRPARAGPDRLRLHERHVHAEENAGLPGQRFIRPRWSRSLPSLLARKADHRKRRRRPFAKAKHDGRPVDLARANGCIGTSTSTAWNTRTI